MSPVFVDANIFLRHLLQDVPAQSRRATAFIGDLELKHIEGETSTTVVSEVVFVLERTHKHPKAAVARGVLHLLSLPGLALPDIALVREALSTYVERNISYNDAFNAALMRRRGIAEVISFDHDFDRTPGITRREP